MKTGFKIYIYFIIFFIFQDLISQQITYSGPVQYKSIHTRNGGGSGSNRGMNYNISVDERFIIEGTLYVTFTGGITPVGVAMYQMTSIEEDIHIEKTVNNEFYHEKMAEHCFDGYLRFIRTETPGESRAKKLSVKSERSEPDKPCIFSGNLTIISPPSKNIKEPTNGKYSIMLVGQIKTDVTYMSYEEMKFPCDPTINKPPSSLTKTVNISFPIAIVIEKAFDGSSILEGRKVIKDNHSKDSEGLAEGMAHGDVDYAIDENITISWTLVKRTKECDANLTKVNGDVKINGEPVNEGNVKIAAGDMISTGAKSRIQINMPGGNEVIILGPNSNFLVKDPCKLTPPKEIKDPHYNGYRFLRGKLFQAMQGNTPDFEVKTRTCGVGVRGQITPAVRQYYCSNNNIGFGSGPYFDLVESFVETDPEKESMIKAFGDLSAYKMAFYIHSEPEAIYDVSAIKGDILVESSFGPDKMVVKEGETATSWPNGTPFFDIYVSAK